MAAVEGKREEDEGCVIPLNRDFLVLSREENVIRAMRRPLS